MKTRIFLCLFLLLSIISCHDSDKGNDTAIYYTKEGLTQDITSNSPLLPLHVGDTFELYIETGFDTIVIKKDSYLEFEWIGHNKYLGTATNVGETELLIITYNKKNTDAIPFEIPFKIESRSNEYFIEENQYDIETNNSEALKQQIIEDLEASYTPVKYSSLILEYTSLSSGNLTYIDRVSSYTTDGSFILLNDTLNAFYDNTTHRFSIENLNRTEKMLKQDLTTAYQQKFSTDEITKVVVSSVAIVD